jgi:large subunit ribosomal protein L4e
MKANVYSIEGQQTKQIELPAIFNEAIRPDLIKRASLSVRSGRFQAKGPTKLAGYQTSAEYVGRRAAYRTMINISRARLPKLKLAKGHMGAVRIVPQSRGGHAAHPLKPEATLVERINKKENRKAIRSAIAATANKELVMKRGHKISTDVPIIVASSFEALKKTKDVVKLLEKLKLDDELERASVRKTRAGRGKSRGRRYKKRKSALIVVKEDKGIGKAAGNIPGFDVCIVTSLNADLLAPGGVPGRLTIYTETAIEALKNLFK